MFITVNSKRYDIVDKGLVKNVPQACGGRRTFYMRNDEDITHFQAFVRAESSKTEKVSGVPHQPPRWPLRVHAQRWPWCSCDA